jgi:pimeloyl-ACP methyl ester carboxylesterase
VGSPIERRVHVNGIELAYFEWPARDPSRREVVLFAHATGFHARVWDRTIAALANGARVIALDLRGHGRTEKKGPYTWDTFGTDVAQTIVALGLERIIGVGHSMGGHAMTQAVAHEEARFERLLLVDPVIMDPAFYAARFDPQMPARADDHPTSKRRNDWLSWQEMLERFASRYPFTLWRPEVLEDYCRYGLLPNPDGPGFVLACPPRVEASVYAGSAGRDIYDVIPSIELPVTVLRAPPRDLSNLDAMDFSASPTWSGLAQSFKNGHDVLMPQLTHFIPMQEPDLVAAHVEDRATA